MAIENTVSCDFFLSAFVDCKSVFVCRLSVVVLKELRLVLRHDMGNSKSQKYSDSDYTETTLHLHVKFLIF